MAPLHIVEILLIGSVPTDRCVDDFPILVSSFDLFDKNFILLDTKAPALGVAHQEHALLACDPFDGIFKNPQSVRINGDVYRKIEGLHAPFRIGNSAPAQLGIGTPEISIAADGCPGREEETGSDLHEGQADHRDEGEEYDLSQDLPNQDSRSISV